MADITKVQDLDVSGRRVFIRCDFNVPFDEDGRITDDTRIQAALETIKLVRERGGRVILASHLGRPKGKRVQKLSLLPVGERLAELLEAEVLVPDECIGDGPKKLIQDQRESQIVLLENLRFHAGEEADDVDFARELASLCDCYVNDAFGAVHRAHASVHALPRLIRDRAAGLLIQRELSELGALLSKPKRPFVAILGGAKVSDKIKVVDSLLTRVDTLIVGGAMAYTFLAAKGVNLGRSRVETDKIPVAKRTLMKAEARGVDILLPTDHVVVKEIDEKAKHWVETTLAFPTDGIGVDIGPETRDAFAAVIGKAHTLFWNGPMGIFEMPAFAEGTRRIAQAVAKANAKSVVGGGDSVAALKQSGFLPFISHVSTGGGASLEFMEGKDLPGIEALSA